MSRAKIVDNSAAVSLFPFLAVLLCTMGALLVVLIAVSRTAKERALGALAASEDLATAADPTLADSIGQVKTYQAFLAHVATETEKRLRDDQKRMSHLEGHMRALQDRLVALQIAAGELAALEKDHYDDHEQAQRDIERLQKLIANSRNAIESLKEGQQAHKKAFALVPYEGPNGTFRRPIYIECRDGVLVLQPEGVQITSDDLRPPIGAGNPLAAALRAARDHYVRLRPAEGGSRDTEPYALVSVRPSGLEIYSLAQRAIKSADFDFGFELFEEDAEIKYQAPDPQLAVVEQQAIDQARIRQQVLAAAAPRAFRHTALGEAGRFEYDAEPAMGSGFGDSAGGGEAGDGEFVDDGSSLAAPSGLSGGNGTGGAPHDDQQLAGTAASPNRAGDPGSTEEVHVQNGGSATEAIENNSVAQTTVAAGPPPSPAGAATPGEETAQVPGMAVSTGIPAPTSPQNPKARPALQTTRGKDWAFRQNPRTVPVGRSIPVIVRQDHIAVLSDEARPRTRRRASKTIPLHGDTAESIDELVKVVHEQVEDWGIAGQGLSWRPVLTLHVGPDGQRRAEDLARLLQDSGLEIRPAATAAHTTQGDSRATR